MIVKQKLKNSKLNSTNQSAFTIVELLIVIVIIGILALIVIISYVNITKKAGETVLISDLDGAKKTLMLYKSEHGSYPASLNGDNCPLDEEGVVDNNYCLKHSSGSRYTYTSTPPDFKLIIDINDLAFEITGDTAATTSVKTAGQFYKWKQVATGGYATCAIEFDDHVYCWGLNEDGRLGNRSLPIGYSEGGEIPNYTRSAVDTDGVLAGKTIKQVALSDRSTCVIASDDKVYCWGAGNDGQLGNNTLTASSTPVAVDMSGALNGKTAKSIAAGYDHFCIIGSDDKVYCWGSNAWGGLGNNSTEDSPVPVAADGGALSGKFVKSVSADLTTCAIDFDDKAYCWGDYMYMRGDGYYSPNSLTPIELNISALGGKTVKSIQVGFSVTCLIASDDQAYCIGNGANGELGNGTTQISYSFTPISQTGALNGKSIKSMATTETPCALASDNQMYCWGYGSWGMLGNGASSAVLVPTAVKTSGELSGRYIKSFSTTSNNRWHYCVVADDDQIYCWGHNSAGQLGNGDSTRKYEPVHAAALKVPVPPPPMTTLSNKELYIAWPGNSATSCKEWTVPGGNTIKGFKVSQATESNYDFFKVYLDDVEKYSKSGTLSDQFIDTSTTPGTKLKACVTTDSSMQNGYGGEVTAVAYN